MWEVLWVSCESQEYRGESQPQVGSGSEMQQKVTLAVFILWCPQMGGRWWRLWRSRLGQRQGGGTEREALSM